MYIEDVASIIGFAVFEPVFCASLLLNFSYMSRKTAVRLPRACSSVSKVIGGDLQRILLEESFILLVDDWDVRDVARFTEFDVAFLLPVAVILRCLDLLALLEWREDWPDFFEGQALLFWCCDVKLFS